MNPTGPREGSAERRAKENILIDLQPLHHGAWAHMNLNRLVLFGRNIAEATSSRQYDRFRSALTEYSLRVHPILRSLAHQFQHRAFEPSVVQALRFHADELMNIVQDLSTEPEMTGEALNRLEQEIPQHVDQLLHALRLMREEAFRWFSCKPGPVFQSRIDHWSERMPGISFLVPAPLMEEEFRVVSTERELEMVLDTVVENGLSRVEGAGPGRFVFMADRMEDRWNLEIRDTRTLVPPGHWREIFTVSGSEGSPGGLSALPPILQKYDADICVRESSEEGGTVFLVRFKLVKDPSSGA